VSTQGFNPHPKIRVRPAAPLGVILHRAAAEFALVEERETAGLVDDVNAALPAGITVESATELPTRKSSMMTETTWLFDLGEAESAPSLDHLTGDGLTFECPEKGMVLVSMRAPDGREPPGARSLAARLESLGDPMALLRTAKLTGVQFEDGR
jgi:hypothetical protein